MQTHEITRAASGIAACWNRLGAVWRRGDFRWYWLASSIQGLGQSTQFMVIGWLVLEITGSSAQLGLACRFSDNRVIQNSVLATNDFRLKASLCVCPLNYGFGDYSVPIIVEGEQ